MLARKVKTLKSRKFIAYLVSDLTSTVLLAYGIYAGNLGDQPVLLAVALGRAVMSLGFILGQAYVDRYVDVVLASRTTIDTDD